MLRRHHDVRGSAQSTAARKLSLTRIHIVLGLTKTPSVHSLIRPGCRLKSAHGLSSARRPRGLPDHPVLPCGLPPGLVASPEGGGAPERRTSLWFGLATVALFAESASPSGAPPRRFLTPSPCFFDRTGGVYRFRDPGSNRAALHPIASSHLKQPPHRVRTVTAPPGPWLRATAAGAASPLRRPNVSGRRPQ